MLFYIKGIPGSSRNKVGDTRLTANGQHELVLYVTAQPEKGQANKAVISLLADHLGVSPSHLEIVRGQTSRHKVIRLHAPDKPQS